MKTRKINIRLEGNDFPIYETNNSSGCDVKCLEDFTLQPMERKMVHTGIYMELPNDVECQVRSRSGLAIKHGVIVINSPGTIDSDYRGECNVLLINLGDKPYEFKKGERIAQFVFVTNVIHAEFDLVACFKEHTDRGEGGFGHTGK